LSFTRRKRFTYAVSRLRRASCGAHWETPYIQGTSVRLSWFSIWCSSMAFGAFSPRS
jgi:hypothetical protein